MKATDFRREHFENGRHFSQADFDAYIAASIRAAKAVYTRYLPCVLGGVLASLVFSQGVGGFAGNMLALACIFGGLIAGALAGKRPGDEVKRCAARLGVTRGDVAAARKHVKNGAAAWNQNSAR